MARFKPSVLEKPSSVEEALALLKKWSTSARIVAGNTTLHELSGQGGLDDVNVLIDIAGLGLSYVTEDEQTVHVGAMTTFSKIAKSKALEAGSSYALKEASEKLKPIQIRNMGTIDGSTASGIPLYDLPAVLLALDAKVISKSVEGTKTIGMDDFFLAHFVTALAPEDLLVEVQIPIKKRSGSSFVKLGRTSVDYAVVNASARVTLDDESHKVSDARIALGAVASTPIRHRLAEQRLIRAKISEDVIAEASSQPLDFDPSPSIHASSEYKRIVIPVIVRDCITAAASRAR
jgi:carbon-monoxide dehydrogenase medium subunit